MAKNLLKLSTVVVNELNGLRGEMLSHGGL